MTPLAYGKLSPQFSLEGTDGRQYTRGQFRGKSGLVLIFFQSSSAIESLLKAVCEDESEYQELNSRLLGIGRSAVGELKRVAESLNLCFPLLADPQGEVWQAYSGLSTPGYGVVVLDLYGGVDAQKIVNSAADLPDAKTILQWTRAAQYKCNI